VTLGLRVGEGWKGEALPRIPPYIERFVVRSAGGERPVPGRPGQDPAGRLEPVAGVQTVLYQSRPYVIDVEGPTFEKYLREEGLDRAAELRAKRGESGQATRERFSRCAKAVVRAAGSGDDGGSALRAFGCPLELVADSDPTAGPAKTLPAQVLWKGLPLANVQVMARPRDDPEQAVKLRTDAQGRVRIPLRAGVWLVKAIHIQEAPVTSGVAWESFWASLTFEAP
jgi:hypothetical protein